MNWKNLVIAALVGVFLVLLLRLMAPQEQLTPSSSSPTPAPTEQAPVTSEAQEKKVIKPVIQTLQTVISPLPMGGESVPGDYNSYPYKLSNPRWVEFRVAENGYAIAYGDVILGKVKPDMTEAKGVFEPPASKLWDSAQIPYAFDENLRNTKAVEEAIAYLTRETPIRLVPAKDEKDMIVFVPSEKECASVLGKIGGQQPILVSPQCGLTEMLHEIMHALGFVHEHSRIDRDQFVEVFWDNIQDQYISQFHVVPDTMVHQYQGSVFDFDYNSIMLYPADAFAKVSGTETLHSITGRALTPTYRALSPVDKERLFYLYGR